MLSFSSFRHAVSTSYLSFFLGDDKYMEGLIDVTRRRLIGSNIFLFSLEHWNMTPKHELSTNTLVPQPTANIFRPHKLQKGRWREQPANLAV